MKILLTFTLYLISGSVGCFDVIGYPGGTVLIFCNRRQKGMYRNYLCKYRQRCEDVVTSQGTAVHNRFSIQTSTEGLTVSIRQLDLQDTGTYHCGGNGIWHHVINLKVKSDQCCTSPKIITGERGETITISCTYPEMFEQSYKCFYKTDSHSFIEMINSTQSVKDRFSMSDDRSVNVVSVNISDVREADGGVYYCGVIHEGKLVSYYSLFTKIQLHVTERSTTASPERTTHTERPETKTERPEITTERPEITLSFIRQFGYSVIIGVCVCVALLLIGGLVMFYKLRCKSQDTDPSTSSREMRIYSEISYTVSEKIKAPKPRSDPGDTPLYSTVQLHTILSNPPNTIYATAVTHNPL